MRLDMSRKTGRAKAGKIYAEQMGGRNKIGQPGLELSEIPRLSAGFRRSVRKTGTRSGGHAFESASDFAKGKGLADLIDSLRDVALDGGDQFVAVAFAHGGKGLDMQIGQAGGTEPGTDHPQ